MPRTLVFDAEALSALARSEKGMAEKLTAALRNDHRVVVPSIVLAEVMNGSAADAAVWNVVKRIPVVNIDTQIAGRAGGLRTKAHAVRRKPRDLTVDAVIASVAIQTVPSVVLTSDPDDLALLVDGHDVVVSEL